MKYARLHLLAFLAVTTLLAGCMFPPREGRPPRAAAASELVPMYFYPERGQQSAQQDRDRYECYRWAVGQSGFDPGMAPVNLSPAAPQPPVGPDGAEIASGALAGAVIGTVASPPHHFREGAVIGAIFGAALGVIAQESRAQADAARRQQDDAAQQAASAKMDDFRRAMGACMAGRGYRVG